MTHIGIIAHPLYGHLNPTIALARELESRGHRVTFFGAEEMAGWVARRGLVYVGVGRGRRVDLHAQLAWLARIGGPRGLLAWQHYHAQLSDELCRVAPAAIRDAGVELLLVDQVEPAGQAVAEHLGLPFVTLCCAMALNRDPRHPPIFTGWPYGGGPLAALRNRIAVAVGDRAAAGAMWAVARHRRRWGLPKLALPGIYYAESPLAVISQQTASLDFPRAAPPPWFHYTGPWREPGDQAADFPWDALAGRPFGYASLGTSQYRREAIFARIARAFADLDLPLVLAHGGGLDAAAVRRLPGSVVAVPYAPQLALLARATVAVSHGGLNTVLDSLAHGVPLALVPLAFEQPAVAARVRRAGAGVVVPPRQLPKRLPAAVRAAATDQSYRAAAHRIQAEIRAAGGTAAAADIVERVVATGRPALHTGDPVDATDGRKLPPRRQV